jgi:hypothetical protein
MTLVHCVGQRVGNAGPTRTMAVFSLPSLIAIASAFLKPMPPVPAPADKDSPTSPGRRRRSVFPSTVREFRRPTHISQKARNKMARLN